MKKIIEEFKNLDKSIFKVLKSGIHFSFIFCLFATFVLAIYKVVHVPKLLHRNFIIANKPIFLYSIYNL